MSSSRLMTLIAQRENDNERRDLYYVETFHERESSKFRYIGMSAMRDAAGEINPSSEEIIFPDHSAGLEWLEEVDADVEAH